MNQRAKRIKYVRKILAEKPICGLLCQKGKEFKCCKGCNDGKSFFEKIEIEKNLQDGIFYKARCVTHRQTLG